MPLFQFTVFVPGTKEKVVFGCPFTIGTIPYQPNPSTGQLPPQQMQQNLIKHPAAPLSQPSAPSGTFSVEIPSPSAWPGAAIPLDPPPSYPSAQSSAPTPTSFPSAPPLTDYESGSGMFLTTSLPLKNTPELPDFHHTPTSVKLTDSSTPAPCPCQGP